MKARGKRRGARERERERDRERLERVDKEIHKEKRKTERPKKGSTRITYEEKCRIAEAERASLERELERKTN